MDFSNLTDKQKMLAKQVVKHAVEIGVDPELALAVAFNESKFNAGAIGPETRKGHRAYGAMQVLETNAPAYNVTKEDLLNPDVGIPIGMKILKENLDRHGGNKRAALVGYNFNPKGAENYMKHGEDDSLIPPETREYLKKIHDMHDIGYSQEYRAKNPQLTASVNDIEAPPEHLFGKKPSSQPEQQIGTSTDDSSIDAPPEHLTEDTTEE